MPGDEGEATRIEWEYAQEVRRDSPLVAALSVALGLTDETLDNLYKVAAGLWCANTLPALRHGSAKA